MIFMTDAPAEPLIGLLPMQCWLEVDRLISNTNIIQRDFESDESKIWVTQISGPPEEREWMMGMVQSLREMGFHAAITAG